MSRSWPTCCQASRCSFAKRKCLRTLLQFALVQSELLANIASPNKLAARRDLHTLVHLEARQMTRQQALQALQH